MDENEKSRRRLSAIMFTDIKGFTSMMEKDETTAVQLIKAHREIVRRNISAFGGEERETIGDAFLVIFDSSVHAVQCAIAMQQELSQFNRDRAGDKQVWMRIGLHLGDIIIEEGSVYGEGVNLAARVQQMAHSGGICITQQIFDQVRHRLNIQVKELSVRELKNVTDVPHLYRIIFETTAPPAPETLRDKVDHFFALKSVKFGLLPLLALALTAAIYSTFFATHTIYATSVAYRFHIPQPIGRVSAGVAKQAHRIYIFSKRRGRVVRLERVERLGMTPEEAEQPWNVQIGKKEARDFPLRVYRYHRDGSLEEEDVFDRYGMLQFKLLFQDGGKIIVAHDTRDFVKTFENQIAGFSYELNDKGRVLQWDNRNPFGALRLDANGVASVRINDDERGLPIEERYFDQAGNLIENKDGAAVRTFQRDNAGRVTRETTLDRYQAVKETRAGYAIVERDYDPAGNVREERYFDRTGTPVETNLGVCRRRFQYAPTGQLIEESVQSCPGTLKSCRYGWAIMRYTYDDQDRLASRRSFDAEDQPTIDTNGVHLTTIETTPEGRISRVGFHGTKDEPVLNAQGTHAIVYRYDDQGHPTTRTYLGTDGKSTVGTSGGYGELRVRYNDHGDVIEYAYFDGEGNLINHRDGFAVIRYEYDDTGNLISRAVYDKRNEPVLQHQPQCHLIRYRYDDRGNLVEKRCFDGHLKLTAGQTGCAIMNYTYDVFGNVTRHECYIEEGKLIDAPNIPSILMVTYDKRGYLNEVRAYNAQAELAERYQGAAIWRRKSDVYGNEIEIATYDRNERLIINPKFHGAIFRRKFDDRGNALALMAFDEQEQPTIGSWGSAEIRYAYDERNHRIAEAYFDEQGKPTTDRNGVHEKRWRFDERGRRIESRFHGADGALILNHEGMAINRLDYDEWGRLNRFSCFGTNDELVINKSFKAAIEEYTLDDRGNIIRITRLDEPGKLCADPECIPIIEQQFDSRGDLTKQSFHDATSKPMTNKDGIGIIHFEHDTQGREMAHSFFDVQDRPSTDRLGVHQYHLFYFPEAEHILWYTTFSDHEGKQILAKDGSTFQLMIYDELYREKRIASVNVTTEGLMKGLECLDDAGNVTDHRDCITTERVQKEFSRLKKHLPMKTESE
ncbi:MAG: hypothetical protein HY465_04745 [Deltaproteobacteria bacterium]|nr:hypothetical protein [Deltaproteobacteria bacterium]